ncbi:MAG: class I SAM-dependent methyltransferase [Candidatus Omnitrophica bacterium]|nr:class I SAM-dependent methyltransferase [Candidatus Omnitrophota bacterium]MBU0880846.1 class I SAM-dependent methyltransferase [Candidatus Omnitrophota bacterium]MBU1808078.1 class I SAM-dependent methyltransferase [Candidatus Omnitrophota bacterium]
MNRCIICDRVDVEQAYPGILRCLGCGHVFCNMPSQNNKLSELYGKNYFFGGEYSDYLADKKITRDNFKLRLKKLRKFLDPMRHKRLLEIGCAYGFFLDVARSYFGTLKGIDVTADGVAYARDELGLDVVTDDFLPHDFNGQKFDVVCLWDTIEHLSDPAGCLSKISKNMMDKGALVAITTGDVGSLNARMKKNKWRIMNAPTHIHYFSKQTLSKLLDNNGFDVIYSGYCGFYRSIDMTLHRISLANKGGRWFCDILRKSGLGRAQFYLNLYDIMYIIARKR